MCNLLLSIIHSGHLSKSSQIDQPHSLPILWIYNDLSNHCPIYAITYLFLGTVLW